MKNITLFKTKSNASYCHSAKVNQFLLTHPILNHLLSLHKQGISVRDYVERVAAAAHIEIEGYGKVSRQELEYHYEKYKLLSDNGYLGPSDTEKRPKGQLSAYAIKSNLANTEQVTFEVTDACNLKCDYCAYGKFYNNYDRRASRKLSFKRARNILDYLLALYDSPLNKSRGRVIYIGFYGGEPLLNFPFIEKIVTYLKGLPSPDYHFAFGMTTNAVLLDKYMDFLVEHDFSLLISLDGNEANNGFRVFANGKPAFPVIYKNIKALEEKYPVYFHRRVNINSVLHSKNSVSDIHRFTKKEFGKVPRISQINTGGIAPGMLEEFKKTYRNFSDSINEAEDYSLIEKDMLIGFPDAKDTTSTLYQYSGFVSRRYDNLLFSMDKWGFIPTGTCTPFSKKLFVLANGKILPCERIGHQFELGYVDEEKVELDLEEIAGKYNRYYDKIREQCNRCNIMENCKQCIFYLDIDSEKPVCSGRMNEKDFSKYLAARMSYLEDRPELYNLSMKKVIVA